MARNVKAHWFFIGVAVLMGGVLLRAGISGEGAGFQAQISAINPASELINTLTEVQRNSSTLLFMGDIMLSRGVELMMDRYGDLFYPFRLIAEEIQAADFVFGNLENPISARGHDQGSIYSFRARPGVVGALRYAGFDALSLANNHMWDWGSDALTDTIELLTSNNIQAIGAGRNYSEANDAQFVVMDDGTTLALFAYTNLMPRSLEATETRPGLSAFEPEIIKMKIQEAGIEADIVVVSLHWGEEYETSANSYQRELARELIDAGADLIIGHHPHVVQEVEKYEEGYIAYSLGNFIFDQGFSKATTEGLMLKVLVEAGEITGIEKIPVHINKTFQPMVATGNE